MSKSIDNVPVIQAAEKKVTTLLGLQRKLSDNINDAIDVLQQVMMNARAKDSDKVAAAGKVIDFYLKIEKQRQDSALQEQQKRLNALRINREVFDLQDAAANYKAPNSLSFDVSEENRRLEKDSLMS